MKLQNIANSISQWKFFHKTLSCIINIYKAKKNVGISSTACSDVLLILGLTYLRSSLLQCNNVALWVPIAAITAMYHVMGPHNLLRCQMSVIYPGLTLLGMYCGNEMYHHIGGVMKL